MYISTLVKKLSSYQNGTLLEIIWKDNRTFCYELDTLYDTDNGWEIDDTEYKEYHAALLRLHEQIHSNKLQNHLPKFVEVGDDKNNPLIIKLVETGEIIWKDINGK